MKSVVASLGMFAALANAYSYPRHMHFPRGNGTDDTLTTLTVIATQVHTVTSCKPTVTNCPAGDKTAIDQLPETDKTTAIVTETIILTETVCPVTEAGAISSSIIDKASSEGFTGATITAPIPLSTGSYPEPTQGGQLPGGEDDSTVTTFTTEYVTDKVVTLTIGTGTDASTVVSTIQTTVASTVTVTHDGSDGSSEENDYPSPGDEPTTTVTDLVTEKITKTIENAAATETKTAGGQLPGGHSNSEGEGSGDSSECVDSTVTVTVTAPASTVYVTVGDNQTKGPESTETEAPGSSNGEGDDSDDEDDDDEDDDEYCSEDTTTTVEATVTVVPYPINGTTTGGYAQPTGFSRRLR